MNVSVRYLPNRKIFHLISIRIARLTFKKLFSKSYFSKQCNQNITFPEYHLTMAVILLFIYLFIFVRNDTTSLPCVKLSIFYYALNCWVTVSLNCLLIGFFTFANKFFVF